MRRVARRSSSRGGDRSTAIFLLGIAVLWAVYSAIESKEPPPPSYHPRPSTESARRRWSYEDVVRLQRELGTPDSANPVEKPSVERAPAPAGPGPLPKALKSSPPLPEPPRDTDSSTLKDQVARAQVYVDALGAWLRERQTEVAGLYFDVMNVSTRIRSASAEERPELEALHEALVADQARIGREVSAAATLHERASLDLAEKMGRLRGGKR